MTVDGYAVYADDYGDVAVACDVCGQFAYAPVGGDVTLGILVRRATEHASIHEPVSVGRHTAPIPVSDPTGTVNA